ncbi:carbohydrate ABC transporter permease [Promicromonospora citrea]|uniref:Sugar ABC transporter permease n=1 Tax=Promicromonospora citrea TaxID=43677 RepID=A0A8H9GQU6_9MICO|nr:carbohydrate ABC transporter permease [Promicromonospora citrea]NNH54410.1 carbohydrate ABC transporter permease [Promicromonospora citrea]GGM38480.1 sugar ABC transporter permease [Promicromonospora citrea]
MSRPVRPGRVVAWLAVGVAVLVTVFPFYWMVRTALTPAGALVQDATLLWPSDPTLINFRRVLGLTTVEEAVAAGGTGAAIDFVRYTANSLLYAGSVAVVQTLSCAAAAYAFARLRFPGRDALFGVVLAGLMVPGIFTLLPNFALLREAGLLNTMVGLVAPAILTSPFTIFFLRQFFLSLPREVEEAAMLDGVGSLGRFWRIALPMSRGPLATMALITLVGMWKDYLWPLVAGNSEATRVLTVALGVFQQQSPNTAPDWTGLMAGSTLSVLPVLVLLVLLGRQLVESLNFSGGK